MATSAVRAESSQEDSPEYPGVTLFFFLVHVVLPIVIGGVIYILWRSDALLMFDWAASLGLTDAIIAMRAWASPLGPWLPEWLLFSVPDGAWVYSATAFFTRLWPDGPWPVRFGWIGMASALAIGGELGQLLGFVPGTFDIVDVIAYAVAAVAAFYVGNWTRR